MQPELFQFVQKPRPARPKEGIYLRLDKDLVRWFRSQGRGYQAMINDVLRAFVDFQKPETKISANIADRVQRAQELYREFHAQCFWHLRPDLEITPENLELVVRGLRNFGGKRGYLLAEQLCR